MKPEIAKRLADELESGRWEKYDGRLGVEPNKRCCLGVLQEIAPSEMEHKTLVHGVPSLQVQEWAGCDPEEIALLATENDKRDGWQWHINYLRSIAEGEQP